MICLSVSKTETVKCLTKQSGFSLIEMAIVLVILGFILSGVVGSLSTQRETQKRNETQKHLEEIRNAIMGYVQINGRLPCPASTTSQGRPFPTTGACTGNNSLVPYADLGIRGAISGGVLTDAWQQHLRYRVTSVSGWSYVTTPINFAPTAADFRICTSLPCVAASTTATDVVFVLFSTGDPDSPSVNLGPTNTDFLYTTPTAGFDDLFVWTSRSELVYAISKTK